jgi:hypothetical protein
LTARTESAPGFRLTDPPDQDSGEFVRTARTKTFVC